MKDEWAIDIEHLTKVFDKKTVVDDISLRVKKGSVFGFLGSNGSGKTTTIRMICGLLTPSAGTGYCLGFNIKTQSDLIKARIGYMPQKFSFYRGLTVYENLQFIASIYQTPAAKEGIAALLLDLGLTPYQYVKVGNLSGGWQQRLALACCLVHKPELLFLDEPTAGVDPEARKNFWDYLHKIAMRDGTTVLVTTHYMDEAEKCTDLAYIHLGHLLYSGPTGALIPFSKVKTFVLEVKPEAFGKLYQTLLKTYPKLLVSVVNNTLRVSSRDEPLLKRCLKEQTCKSKSVPPSFEEVFIGLMQS